MSPYQVIATGFAALLAAMLVLDAVGRTGWASLRPVGDVLHAALARRAVRWLVMAAWLWLGFHFLAR
ncbi:DUF6186 family protein [Pseudonocardia sp.]|uniref:DUF6186 family protein n=1 Tax=Pseudonocardia sp. TaxID=60912 RepID=UPI003D0AD34D